MHLKSLTLRGFKSFASATTLRFEPGITTVVGPNGSGKSNIVDAIAWVLGEQGAKALRGGKMEDVIFAGTAGRPPLGRAEVVLTIDNSDGALPIEYAEVTISRIMFRNGGSEYSINGNACRLLDVQELLSDSGIGRELHVIIGQGQLDAVLQASPEERRGFIEEAAGILKHRKRKEKALRKLDAMQINLNRVTDLTGELRRQLKPLGRQAEIARRAVQVQADLRDARLRLLADDLATLREALDTEVADENSIRERRSAVEAELATVAAREAELEQRSATEAPRLARAQETWYRLSSLRERFRGTASLAAERVRRSGDDELTTTHRGGREPEDMEREAKAVRDQERELAEVLHRDQAALAEATATRVALEAALAVEEKSLVAAARAVADRREGLARLTGQVGALRSRSSAAEAEIGRLAAGFDEAVSRAEAAEGELAALEAEVAGLDEGEVDLDSAYEAAAARLAEVEDGLRDLVAHEREAERDRSALQARREALALSLARKDGSGALLSAGDRLPGLLGSVSSVLTVDPGAETAVAAALGVAADAVAVGSISAAADALALLRADDAGRSGLMVGSVTAVDRSSWPQPPSGTGYLVDRVRAPEALVPTLARLLERILLVDDLDQARAVVEADARLRAVTRDGDLLGAEWSVGGSAGAPSLLEVQAAVDEADAMLAEVTQRGERLRVALAAADEERVALRAQVESTLEGLNASDARMAAFAEQLGRLGGAARAAAGEAERLQAARVRAEEARDRDLAGLSELEERLAAASSEPQDDDADPTERDRLALAGTQARSAEMEARLAVRTTEERARALAGRADGLDKAAARERAERERLADLRERRVREARTAGAVSRGVAVALTAVERSLAAAADERQEAETSRTVREGELLAVRGRHRDLTAELETLTSAVHRDEVARAEQRLRIEALEAKALEDYGVAPDELVAEYGPAVPVPLTDQTPPPAPGEEPKPVEPVDLGTVAYDRAEQQKRAATADRALALLGKVNPLALEEFSALEERHTFLQTQLEDLKATRRDLLTVVKDIDERIHEVFSSAYEDVAREFEVVFSILFPGGQGRLVLTDAADLLASGIEIEARPPGKKVKRLSLLSGGERSLTAVAFLCAIFRARPSPFYVLDEVEAALDDRNLGRLLDLLSELRSTSQLIIITHQKRTMEIADALYGVSMRGDGITAVISQRLREVELA
ncbi:chromosome segregation protein SMC [Acidothermaceae bacterium B102]|nr:chromosome segregation protein SMC [Acidothermaceae bacterium B102]